MSFIRQGVPYKRNTRKTSGGKLRGAKVGDKGGGIAFRAFQAKRAVGSKAKDDRARKRRPLVVHRDQDAQDLERRIRPLPYLFDGFELRGALPT